MNTKMNSVLAGLSVIVLSAVACQSAAALTLASTDFDGRTISGFTANTLTWSTNGLNDPGSLTVVDEAPTGDLAGLFDTAEAADLFVPNKNIETEGPWSVSIPLTVTDLPLQVESMSFDYLFYNNSGDTFTDDARSAEFIATITGSSSGLLGTFTSGIQTSTIGANVLLTFGSSVDINSAETYELKLFVDGSSNTLGVNLGLDNLFINGSIVQPALAPIPEPSSALLLGLGMCGLMQCRRRKLRKAVN